MKILVGCAFVLVGSVSAACGGDKAASGSSEPAKSAAPSAKSAASAAATASAAPSAVAAAQGPKEFASGAEFRKLLKLPEGSIDQKIPNMDGFLFLAPKDVKLTKMGGMDRKRQWGTIAFGDHSMAALLSSPEQDEGENCLKLADAKTKLTGAKILREEVYSVPVADGKNTDYGEDIELIRFERDGKPGFYVHKEFNHGDDSTHLCCTAGAPADAKELKGSDDAAKFDALTSVCLSMTFNF